MIGLHPSQMLHPLSGQQVQVQVKKGAEKQRQKQTTLVHYEHQANIVRIPAKSSARPTTTSQIVSSPTANSKKQQLKSSRQQKFVSTKQLLDDNENNVLLIVEDDHVNGGGVPVIGRRLPSKSAAAAAIQRGNNNESNNFYLAELAPSNTISMSHEELPTQRRRRSSGQNHQQVARVIEYPEPPTIRMDQVTTISSSSSSSLSQLKPAITAAPVIGRRSHRLMGGALPVGSHQPAVALLKKQYAFDNLDVGVEYNDNDNDNDISGRPLSHGGRQRAKSTAALALIASNQAAIIQHLGPTTAIKCSKSEQVPHQLKRGSSTAASKQQVAMMSRRGSLAKAGAKASTPIATCSSSLCLIDAGQTDCPDCCNHHCLNADSSCPGGGDCGIGMVAPPSAVVSCQDACCRALRRYGTGQSQASIASHCPLARSTSCNLQQQQQQQSIADSTDIRPTCCGAGPQTGVTSCHGSYHSRSHNHHHHSHHHHHRNSHQTCQANSSLLSSRSSRQLSRTSACGAHGAQTASRQPINTAAMIQQQQQHRNVLPVAPKPIVNYHPPSTTVMMQLSRQIDSSSYHHHHHPLEPAAAGEHSDENAVTQMYESLAAELKAKLGNPKMGPILLPPKDYDTISRKQGKLTGIELRRSTNPQLVGPAAANNRLQQQQSAYSSKAPPTTTTKQEASGVGGRNREIRRQKTTQEQAQVQVNDGHHEGRSAAASGSSARSSGRSVQDNVSLDLQRSISNSSSGLGSISMGAGSPGGNTSPSLESSSNEDIRRTTTTTIITGDNSYNSTRTSSKKYTKVKVNSLSSSSSSSASSCSSSGKNCSPADDTNYALSDSGHSGSGRLDSIAGTSDHTQQGDVEYLSSSSSSPGGDGEATQIGIGNDCCQSLPKAVGGGAETTSWNGRVEIPLKINSDRKNGNTYLATKQIIY